MDFEKHEEEIKRMLEPLSQKKLPESVMKNFEEDVMRKVYAGKMGFPIGIVSVFAFALLLVGAVVFMQINQPKSTIAPASPGQSQDRIAPVEPKVFVHEVLNVKEDEVTPVEIQISSSETLFEDLSEDLFILEMLGEDEGLLDDFSRVEMDIDFWSGTSPVITAS